MTFGDNGDVGFKMFTERDNWSVYYAMTDDATADDISLQLVTDTDAPQVYPGKLGYGKGVYDIEVNLNTMKMTLTAKSIDYSTAYSMTGEATPGGWENRTYLPKKGDNEWEATGVAMNFDGDYKGFKIFASSDGWWPWYGQTPRRAVRHGDPHRRSGHERRQGRPAVLSVALRVCVGDLHHQPEPEHDDPHPHQRELVMYKQTLKAIMTLFLAGSATIGSAANDTMPLHSGWKFRQANRNEWHPATVPGVVHTDLLDNGLIEDPYYRLNERALQWIDKEDWIYEVSFDAGALTRGYEHVRLEFLGLDTYADVFLNETRILTADNMFRRWAAEVKPLLKERGNVLRVYFHSPINKALPQYESLPYRYEAWNDQADNGGLDGKNSAPSPARRAIITAGTGVRGWLRRASGVR